MCGIYGLFSKNNTAPKQVFDGLKDIEYRGYDSWGIAYKEGDSLKVSKEIGSLPKEYHAPSSPIAIGHTRWATHGGVTVENAHPQSDCENKLMLVHNGIVENYLELKTELEGHTFRSQTDTEVIVHKIEEQLKSSTDLKQAVAKTFNILTGLNAIVVTDGNEIIACKNSSPLIIGKSNEGFVLASDPNALLPITNNLLFLEDNQLVVINDQKLSMFNVKNMEKIEPNFQTVDWKHTSTTKENFDHYMIKEIHEQPAVLKNIAAHVSEAEKIAQSIKDSRGCFLIGCGSASYAALAGVYLFSKIADRHINFSIGSEFNYIEDYINDKSMLLAISQSGETMDVVEPTSSVKKRGAKIVALTNTLGSTLYRFADEHLLLEAGVEKAVCATKSYLAMVAYLTLLGFILAGKTKEGQEVLIQSSEAIEKVLEQKVSIENLAKQISSADHVYILGRGLSYPIALEAALKIKEISYIHAEGFAGGELKHGVIALIEKGTPVIVFVPNDETKEAIISNAIEVKARGAYIIGVGVTEHPAFDSFFKVEDSSVSSIFPSVVFSQLLGYFMSLKRGIDPDKPRNLAKSVVVR